MRAQLRRIKWWLFLYVMSGLGLMCLGLTPDVGAQSITVLYLLFLAASFRLFYVIVEWVKLLEAFRK